MNSDPKFHPIEYFGLFIRWKIGQLSEKEESKNATSFDEFKKERLGMFDLFIGFGVLLIIGSVFFFIYSMIRI